MTILLDFVRKVLRSGDFGTMAAHKEEVDELIKKLSFRLSGIDFQRVRVVQMSMIGPNNGGIP